MKRSQRISAITLPLLAALFLFSYCGGKSEEDKTTENKSGLGAMRQPLKTLSGETITLEKHLDKIILLYVWSGDCKTCDKATGTVKKIVADGQGKVVPFGVNRDPDATAESQKQAAAKLGIDFQSIMDPDNSLASQLYLRNAPMVVFIYTKPNGKARLAYADLTDKESDQKLLDAAVKDAMEMMKAAGR